MKDLNLPDKHQRLIALDIMKAVAIFFMFLGHIVMMYGSPAVNYSAVMQGIAFGAEGIGAPAFIFAMGLSIVLTKEKSPKQVLLKGLALILMGYVLNFLKFFPTVKLLHVFPEALFAATGRLNNTAGLISLLWIADILQFAGIAYIACSFLLRFVRNYQIWALLLAILLLAFAPTLYQPEYAGSNYFLQMLYGNNFQVYFPIFPWLGFPLLGMTAGYWIKNHPESLRKTMLIFLPVGLIIFLTGIFLIKSDPLVQFGPDYYHRGLGALVMYSGELLAFLAVLHFISPLFPKAGIKAILFCSRNVTRIYILQWILIYWGWTFIPFGSLPGKAIVPYLLLFITLTLILTAGWEYLSSGRKKKTASSAEVIIVKQNQTKSHA